MFDAARKSIYWLIAGFLIAIVTVTFTSVILSYTKSVTYVTPEVKAETIAVRFTSIPECFAYQDPETKRVYPGIIELSKFTPEQLEDSCYKTNSYHELNFKLRLGTTELKTNNFFEQSPSFNFEPKKVLVRDGTTVREEQLYITVMREI